MKRLRLFLTLSLTLSWLLTSGCLERQVYLEKGQSAEIARPVKIWVWVNNKDSGKRELRPFVAQSGDIVGRRK